LVESDHFLRRENLQDASKFIEEAPMVEESIHQRLAEQETVQQFQSAELTEHARRLGEIEADLRAVIQIVQSMCTSGTPGEDRIRPLLDRLIEKYKTRE
jgi:hypothetical protein